MHPLPEHFHLLITEPEVEHWESSPAKSFSEIENPLIRNVRK
jgi:hypothetical protein